MDLVLPKGKPSRIHCECGREVQLNSMPSHLLSQKHKDLMREKSRVKVERGSFFECSIQQTDLS